MPALLVVGGMFIPLIYLLLRAFEAEPAALVDIVFSRRNLVLLGNTVLLTTGVLVVTSAVLWVTWYKPLVRETAAEEAAAA